MTHRPHPPAPIAMPGAVRPDRPGVFPGSSRPFIFRRPAPLALAAILLLGGCAGVKHLNDPSVRGPFHEPKNYTGVARLPAGLRRVVLLPVAGAAGIPDETLASLDSVMAPVLQQQARFEVVTLSPAALQRLTGRARWLSTDALPAGLLASLAQETGANAAVFVDLTSFSAYPPLSLGFRTKLVSFPDGAILWAFDQVFSTGDPAMANSARHHDRDEHPATGESDLSYTVTQSPTRFGSYAASTAFATLPPR